MGRYILEARRREGEKQRAELTTKFTREFGAWQCVTHHGKQQVRCEFAFRAAMLRLTPLRLGLRLTDKFARGSPAWKYFRYFPYRHPTTLSR
jgi:hypothetical protein